MPCVEGRWCSCFSECEYVPYWILNYKIFGNSTNTYSTGITNGLSQKPDWVMVKRVTDVENWFCTAPFTRLGIPGASGYTANYYLHPDGTNTGTSIQDGGDNIFRGNFTYPDGPDLPMFIGGTHAGVNGMVITSCMRGIV